MEEDDFSHTRPPRQSLPTIPSPASTDGAFNFVLTLSCAYLADRLQRRYFFALFGGLLNLTGLTIQLARPDSASVRYMGTFFMTAGCYVVMPIVVVWM